MESCQVIALCLHRPDVILFRYTCMYYLLSLYVWTLWEWTIPCSDLHHWSYKICAFVNVFIEYVNMYRLIKNVFSFRIMWLMKCCQEWLTCCGLSISLFLYLHHNNKYFYRHTSITSHHIDYTNVYVQSFSIKIICWMSPLTLWNMQSYSYIK